MLRGHWLPPPASRHRRYGVAILAFTAAAIAATDAPAVTGSPLADRFWAGAYAVGLTVAASRARRWVWLVVGLTAAVGGGGTVGVVAGFVALGAAVAGATRERAVGRIGALVGAAGAVALLRWDVGASWLAAVAVVAVGAVVLPALHPAVLVGHHQHHVAERVHLLANEPRRSNLSVALKAQKQRVSRRVLHHL